jgi:LysR substrate binding domain.
MLKQLSLKGIGIACLVEHFVRPQIEEKQLVQILNDWSLPSMDVWAIFPERRLMPSRTRLFIDTLIGVFTD